ncbi:MAG: SDR family oxidoreductase [Spirosomataceae bacterium]
MKSFSQKNIVITGGSEGIGFAIAKQFAQQNANLFLIARNLSKLQAAQQQLSTLTTGKVEVFAGDVGDRAAMEQIIHTIGQERGGIDVLVNNAGYGGGKRFEDCNIEELEQWMSVNYFGTVYTTHAAWGYLKASQGHIGMVSSVAGYTGLWGYTGYAPAKFAMTGLAECLRMEGNDYGIGVTVIYPPDTDTPLLRRSQSTAPPELVALMQGASLMSADDIGRLFMDGVQHNRFEVVGNVEGRLIRVIKGTFPRLFFWILDRILAKARRKAKA